MNPLHIIFYSNIQIQPRRTGHSQNNLVCCAQVWHLGPCVPYHIWLSSTRDTLPTRLFIFRPSSRAHRSLSKQQQQQHTSAPMWNMLRWACVHATKCNKSDFLSSTFRCIFPLPLIRSLTPLFIFSVFTFLISRGITMFIHLPPEPHLSPFSRDVFLSNSDISCCVRRGKHVVF